MIEHSDSTQNTTPCNTIGINTCTCTVPGLLCAGLPFRQNAWAPRGHRGATALAAAWPRRGMPRQFI